MTKRDINRMIRNSTGKDGVDIRCPHCHTTPVLRMTLPITAGSHFPAVRWLECPVCGNHGPIRDVTNGRLPAKEHMEQLLDDWVEEITAYPDSIDPKLETADHDAELMREYCLREVGVIPGNPEYDVIFNKVDYNNPVTRQLYTGTARKKR